jgi:hypothetical protein
MLNSGGKMATLSLFGMLEELRKQTNDTARIVISSNDQEYRVRYTWDENDEPWHVQEYVNKLSVDYHAYPNELFSILHYVLLGKIAKKK